MTNPHVEASLLAAYAPDPGAYAHVVGPNWIDEIDLTPGHTHARMGTRTLSDAHWLRYDALARTEIPLRRRLVREQRSRVFACTPHAQDAAEEVGDLVDRWLDAHAPSDAPRLELEEDHPLARAGTQIQEDVCLMVHHHGAWRLEGAVLCFPSLWRLSDKLGRATTVVHAPVPHYAAELSTKVDSLFDRLGADKLVWRRNVSVWPSLLLWAPCTELDPSLHDRGPTHDGAPALWIRSERQTLRRLRASGAIVFTIRVQCAPIGVLANSGARARDLAAWLRAPIGEVRRRQLGSHLDPLLYWLDGVAESAG